MISRAISHILLYFVLVAVWLVAQSAVGFEHWQIETWVVLGAFWGAMALWIKTIPKG